jgi:hypothetical protein
MREYLQVGDSIRLVLDLRTEDEQLMKAGSIGVILRRIGISAVDLKFGNKIIRNVPIMYIRMLEENYKMNKIKELYEKVVLKEAEDILIYVGYDVSGGISHLKKNGINAKGVGEPKYVAVKNEDAQKAKKVAQDFVKKRYESVSAESIKVGDKVHSPSGYGKIISINGNKAIVRSNDPAGDFEYDFKDLQKESLSSESVNKFDPMDDEYEVDLSKYNPNIIKNVIAFLKKNNIDYDLVGKKLTVDDFATLNSSRQQQFYKLFETSQVQKESLSEGFADSTELLKILNKIKPELNTKQLQDLIIMIKNYK